MAKKARSETIQVAKFSKSLKKALELLTRVKEKSIRGVGKHNGLDCPIAYGFNVHADTTWRDLYEQHRIRLIKNGWDGKAYNAFMLWYDGWPLSQDEIDLIEAREGYLRKLLS